MTASRLCVVKLGGSHALQPHLRSWLAALADCGGKVVVVPGGGLFADAVRKAQPVMGFDDRAAHHMALLAMEQFGVAIAALNETLVCASALADIRAGAAAGRVPVWMPTRMVLADADLPRTWDLTSDSLAAWLAARLRSPRLVLVKHDAGSDKADRVDRLFRSYIASSRAECTYLGPLEAERLAQVISGRR